MLPLDGDRRDDVQAPSRNLSDVKFGGTNLDRLYVTSIALDLGDGNPGEQAAHLWWWS